MSENNKRGRPKVEDVQIKCWICDKEFTVPRHEVKQRQYCSRRCYKLFYHARISKGPGTNVPQGIQNKIKALDVVPDSELDGITFHDEKIEDYGTYTRRLRRTGD